VARASLIAGFLLQPVTIACWNYCIAGDAADGLEGVDEFDYFARIGRARTELLLAFLLIFIQTYITSDWRSGSAAGRSGSTWRWRCVHRRTVELDLRRIRAMSWVTIVLAPRHLGVAHDGRARCGRARSRAAHLCAIGIEPGAHVSPRVMT